MIAALATEVQATGARFLLVTIPTHEQVVDEYWRTMLETLGPERTATFRRDHADERLAALAARQGFDFLPLGPALRAVPEPRETYFGKGHWNETGNRIAALALHRHLIQSDAPALAASSGKEAS